LSRVERVPARSMKPKGLLAQSWEQRSCGVGLGFAQQPYAAHKLTILHKITFLPFVYPRTELETGYPPLPVF
jgi:hypothetical protein